MCIYKKLKYLTLKSDAKYFSDNVVLLTNIKPMVNYSLLLTF